LVAKAAPAPVVVSEPVKAPAAKAVAPVAKAPTMPPPVKTPPPIATVAPPAKVETPAKVVETPAKVKVPAAIETPAKIADALPKVTEVVAEATAKLVEKVAAIPVAVAETVIPTPAAQSTQKGFFTMAETITPKSFVPTPESFQSMLGDMSTRAKTVMENSAKMAEEMGEFAKGNVEALMTSSRVAAKGAETLGQEAAAYSKKSLETATSAFKGFAAAKSPTELFKLQSDYARSSFDAAVAEGSKFSEAVMKLLGEITQPISTRVALAAEKIKTPAF
jgi:phasin family protein